MAEKKLWKKRIVGYGDEPLDEILFNPANWRIHPKVQQEALSGVLEEIGVVQDVIINRTTGNLVDGHLRCQLAARNGEKTIPATYVELTAEEEGIILATLDPIAGMASTDRSKLDDLLKSVHAQDERVTNLISEIGESEGLAFFSGTYTRNIHAPIYRPTGEKPKLWDLYNDERTLQMIAEIETSGVSEDEKAFLRIAAQRHTVINFRLVAEYYAHASKEMQSLMENSALVIIDFDRAIELGYVKLAESVANQYREDFDGEE